MEWNSKLDKGFNMMAALIAVSVGFFHILNVSGIMTYSALTFRAIHLMAMLMLVFLLMPKSKKEITTWGNLVRLTGFTFSVFTGIYILYRWEDIIYSGGLTNSTDTFVAIIMVVLVLIATIRSIGLVLALIALVFTLYPFFGVYLPGILNAHFYSVKRVFNFLYSSTQGVYGLPISVSASYIILFSIYGAFLSEFGAGDFMFKFSRSVTSKLVAATAKTAVIFSTLIGMISGSAAGNVAVTGSLTIPMMKKEGYKPHIAASVEALASTGGQIMPPIMGAAAFIMAQMIGIPYVDVARSALIPALLYFTTIFIIVHLLSLRGEIDYGHDEEESERFITVIKEGWYFVIPIIILIYMLVIGFSPFKAVYYSLVLLIVVYIIAFRDFSLNFIKNVLKAVQKGAYNTVPIAVACAASGIIVGIIGLTGIGTKLVNFIIAISNGQLFLALILTMITSIILGMGLPTTAAYLIPASVVAPALIKMGMPPLPAHMFIFYYACISTITPPVALASYVAAGIAEAEVEKVGWTAFRFGLVSYILPFMFVFSPGLLFQGSALQIITTIIFSLIGIVALAIAIVGYFRARLTAAPRLLFALAGLFLVFQGFITDLIGIMIIALTFIFTKNLTKKGIGRDAMENR